MRKRLYSVLALVCLVTGGLVTSIVAPTAASAATCTDQGGQISAATFLIAANTFVYEIVGLVTLPVCTVGTLTVHAVPIAGHTVTPGTCAPTAASVGALSGDIYAGCASLRGAGGVGVGTVHLNLFSEVVGIDSSGVRFVRTGSCPITLTPTVGSTGGCLI